MMKLNVTTSIVLMFGCLALACSKNEANDDKSISFYEAYGNGPYIGQVESKAFFPGGQSSDTNQGEGSFHLVKGKGDSVKLVLYGKLATSDSISLMLGGIQNGKNWVMSDDGREANVQGQLLSGTLTAGDMQLILKGNLFDNLLLLELDQKFLKEYDNIPSGTVIKYNFDLKKGNGDSGNGAECTNIVWIWKNIWTPAGLQMIQVPECR